MLFSFVMMAKMRTRSESYIAEKRLGTLLIMDRIRLRTSSHVLPLGSSVFVAMLGPHFKEGRALAEKGSVEILLPDDDAQGP